MTYDQPPGGQPWPPQGQPYPQQPQYPPPGYQQPPGYPPQYPPPGPRQRKSWPRRHKILTAILGLFGFFIVIIVIAVVAASGNHTVTTGQAGGTSSSTPSASKAKAATSTARVGSVITLTGNSSGEKMAVAVTRTISHAQPASGLDAPPSGKRLYAVQFRLDDTGSAAYSDSPSNGAAVVDSAGQSYQSSFESAAGCESFPGTENIAAGNKGLGCIVFEVPTGAKITKVQFTLNSGLGPQTGQWDVRG